MPSVESNKEVDSDLWLNGTGWASPTSVVTAITETTEGDQGAQQEDAMWISASDEVVKDEVPPKDEQVPKPWKNMAVPRSPGETVWKTKWK